MHTIHLSKHFLHALRRSLAQIRTCSGAFTDRISPCDLKSLPLLPQREKSQTLSLGRVQEITVYISSCVTWISKLSGFGGGCGGYWASNTIKAGAYHSWPLWCRHRGGSRLYHLCFAPSQLFLFMRLTSGLLRPSTFDVSREALQKGGITPALMTPKPSSPSACWSSSLNKWELLFLFLSSFFSCRHLVCGVLPGKETFCGWP